MLPYFGALTQANFSAVKWPISNPTQKTGGNELINGSSIQIAAPYSTQARVIVAGGNAGFDYQVTCVAETEDGQKFETDFIVRVKEL